MMQLLIESLRKDYEAFDRLYDKALNIPDLTADLDDTVDAIRDMLERTLRLSTSYIGLNVEERAKNIELDVQYIEGLMGEFDMREREDWHYKRLGWWPTIERAMGIKPTSQKEED